MYMPLMMRSLRKLETIIDEELAAIGASGAFRRAVGLS